MDFADIKEVVQPLIDQLDHTHLNMSMVYPSSECISMWFGARILKLLSEKGARQVRVAVSETEDTWAVWSSTAELTELTATGVLSLTVDEKEDLQKRIQGLWVVRAG
jgi:6-pyruvoyl-tetrahydropterin synthase